MRKNMILLLLVITMMLTGCVSSIKNASSDSVKPTNNEPPIFGTWSLVSYVKGSYSGVYEDYADGYLNSKIVFNNDKLEFMGATTNNVSYHYKHVDSNDYLFYRYKIYDNELGFDDEYIDVISIESDGVLLYEVIKSSDNRAFINMHYGFYEMKKDDIFVSGKEKENMYIIDAAVLSPSNEIEFGEAIILGFREYSEVDNGEYSWKYYSYLITFAGEEVSLIKRADELIIPRKNGFYTLGINRIQSESAVYDEPVLIKNSNENEPYAQYKVGAKTMMAKTENDEDTAEENILNTSARSSARSISFVGNDYACFEEYDNQFFEKVSVHVYALDNLAEYKPLTLTALIGEDGYNIYRDGVKSVIKSGVNASIDERNIGVVRKNGYWSLFGRAEYIQNNIPLYTDFMLRTLMPKDMVRYDNLSITWPTLTFSFPHIIDAFTSPSNKHLITIEDEYICCYNIVDGQVDKDPIARIYIGSFPSVVMSEWSSEHYVDAWSNEFDRIGAANLK